MTQVGSGGAAVDAISADLAELRRTSCNLVFHYRGGGDFGDNGIVPERVAEIDSRYADVMFDRLAQLAGPSLTEPRLPAERLIGCCRDFTVLFVAMARHKGIAARARVGFATYFDPGWYIDHVIAEVWDEGADRWRLIEAQVSDEFAQAAGFDPMDLTPDAFLTGGDAWLRARAGEIDPERCVVAPDLEIPDIRGWRYLRHHLVHDLAALNKQEMVLWDQWGLMDQHQPPGPEECEMLDELAHVTSAPDPELSSVRAWAARDGLAVPATVTTYSPAGEVLLAMTAETTRSA